MYAIVIRNKCGLFILHLCVVASLSAYVESMTPNYLQEEYVNVLRWFISQLEKPTAQESASHRVTVKAIHISVCLLGSYNACLLGSYG
ncbi:hypothetical protein Hanom_Chr12g01105481 [Helianthus anomalus]